LYQRELKHADKKGSRPVELPSAVARDSVLEFFPTLCYLHIWYWCLYAYCELSLNYWICCLCGKRSWHDMFHICILYEWYLLLL